VNKGDERFLPFLRIGDGDVGCKGGKTEIPNLDITWILLHCGHKNFPKGFSDALEDDRFGDLTPPFPRLFSSFLRIVSTLFRQGVQTVWRQERSLGVSAGLRQH